MSSFKDFLKGYKYKVVVFIWEAIQKTIAFYHNKDIDMLKLDCTLYNQASPVYINLTLKNSIRSLRETKACCRKWEKIQWADHTLRPRAKQSLAKPSFGNRFFCAKESLVLMRVNSIRTQRANLSQQYSTRIVILIRRPADSYCDRTGPIALKKLSCLISKEQNENVALRASIQQADRIKLIASLLMGFVLLATLCLRLRVAFTTFAPVRKYVPSSLKKISKMVVRRVK